jgi:predicted SprT family Zn-dependent metalloprotease
MLWATLQVSGRIVAALQGAPERTRTSDTRFRKPLLYPLSYWGGSVAPTAPPAPVVSSADRALRLPHHANPPTGCSGRRSAAAVVRGLEREPPHRPSCHELGALCLSAGQRPIGGARQGCRWGLLGCLVAGAEGTGITVQLFAAAALARRLMNQHGLRDWALVFDNAKTRAGLCRPAQRQLGLSRPLTELHSEGEVRDTILHEIAHALVGTEHRHDAVWRAKAREIGCTGDRCVSSDAGQLVGDWTGRCPSGHTVTRHRRPTRATSCSSCSPQFDPEALIEWTFRGRKVPMGQGYIADLAELRRRQGIVAAAAAATASREGTGTAPPLPLPAGTQVQILGEGRYAGLIGRILKRGRTRYHILTSQGLLTASPALVRPL